MWDAFATPAVDLNSVCIIVFAPSVVQVILSVLIVKMLVAYVSAVRNDFWPHSTGSLCAIGCVQSQLSICPFSRIQCHASTLLQGYVPVGLKRGVMERTGISRRVAVPSERFSRCHVRHSCAVRVLRDGMPYCRMRSTAGDVKHELICRPALWWW